MAECFLRNVLTDHQAIKAASFDAKLPRSPLVAVSGINDRGGLRLPLSRLNHLLQTMPRPNHRNHVFGLIDPDID